MVQAYAQQLLNQKESEKQDSGDSTQRSLYAATQRLVIALDRLERNLQYVEKPEPRNMPDDRQLGFFQNENESLRQERENLNTAITQLQDQYTDLHQVASTIYGKLDDSIKRLTQIIEN